MVDRHCGPSRQQREDQTFHVSIVHDDAIVCNGSSRTVLQRQLWVASRLTAFPLDRSQSAFQKTTRQLQGGTAVGGGLPKGGFWAAG
jgi:hypothetical protein